MRIYMAGTSGLEDRKDLVKSSKYILESYIYIKPWQIDIALNAKGFILDSGAFTFMASGKHRDIMKYAAKYAEFVREYDIENFIEMDVESVVGWEEYLKINDVLCKISGKQPIPVFHKTRGLKWWQQCTRQFDQVAYGGVAIAGGRNQKIDFEVMPEFIKIAHNNGAKCHGLGFTQTQKFNRIRFDSVDSTTWTMASRLGIMCFFTGKRMIQFHSTEKGKKMKAPKELLWFNYMEWLKFQDYAEKNL